MKVVLAGTIDLFQVQEELNNDLVSVRQTMRALVDARPFGEHTEQDLLDYVNLRDQEEKLKADLS